MTERRATNLTWSSGTVSREERERIVGQRGCVVWLTGLSGSGKSTIARTMEQHLLHEGRISYVLDGDNVRHRLNRDLAFSPEDRKENIRRISEVAALFADSGLITITAFIAPYAEDRLRARDSVESLLPGRFFEVYVDVPLELCEQRDPKSLYKKARNGEIHGFTGIDAPYEVPSSPDLAIAAGELSVEECVRSLLTLLRKRQILPDQATTTWSGRAQEKERE